MRAFLLGLLLYALLFAFGRYYFMCKILNQCDEKQEQLISFERDNSLYLVDGADTLGGPFNQFYFKKDSINPVWNASNKAFVEVLTDFLKENPTRTVRLVGKYSAEEAELDLGILPNLGIARAGHIERAIESKGIDQKRLETAALKATSAVIKEPFLFQILPEEIPENEASN